VAQRSGAAASGEAAMMNAIRFSRRAMAVIFLEVTPIPSGRGPLISG